MKKQRTISSFSHDSKHNDSTYMGILPQEVQTKIIALVARNSLPDLTTCKLSCKLLKEIAENGYIYRNVSLEGIEITNWSPNINRDLFLARCEQYCNPEMMYRIAVISYFDKKSIEVANQYLKVAMEQGHVGAFHLRCIIQIYNGDEEAKLNGIKLLGIFLKSIDGKIKVREIRKKLRNHLRGVWLNWRPRPIKLCHNEEENHKKKFKWEANDYFDSLTCEYCLVDFELLWISGEVQY